MITGVGTHLTMGAFAVALADGSKLKLALKKGDDGKFLVESRPQVSRETCRKCCCCLRRP